MRKSVWMMAFLAFSWNAQAQTGKTLGDILDAGASKLSRADVETQVIDSWFSFKGQNGGDFNLHPDPNGMVTGHVQGFKSTAPGRGTWNIGDEGKLCIDFHYAYGSMVGDFNRCHYWFGMSGKYWGSPSATDRTAPTLEILSLKK
jgi:hypothetical protein